jgi:threonine dehydratase
VRAGDLTFEVIRARVDDVVLVGDEEILETCRYLILEEKIVAEPSGAAALAAVRHGKIPVPPGPVVCVVSGGNFDPKVVFG